MSTSVKHIHNGMRGAPQISGTVGAGIIPVLDALFISGWGVTTAVSVSVASGIATATLTSGETFDRTAVVLIAGATPAELNGEARVLTSSLTSITWATTAADGVATGTITIKYAPQTDWVKVYAGTNKAVYKSTHAQSNGHYLRIDDTGTTSARIRAFESMSDVDTGTGPFPTDAQMSGGGYWWKSTVANATANTYRVVCDQRFVLPLISAGVGANASQKSAPARGFGDPITLAPSGDAWCTLLSVGGSSTSAPGASSFVNQSAGGASSGMTLTPRLITGLGSSASCLCLPFTGGDNSSGVTSGNSTTMGAMPSPVDGQIKTSKMFAREPASGAARSIVPGVFFIPQSGHASVIVDGDILSGSAELAGRKLLAVADPGAVSGSFAVQGVYLVDITGPWR
ncbi:MAG: hypothetical protein Q8S71_11960 [Hydrogenophaga sp.]|nr:hypothetical protein [Hydrogenophaga sp.]